MCSLTPPLRPSDSSVTSEMQNALAEKYQGLLRDFVDKTKPVDLTAVSDDMQMPRPALLEEKGIMSDSYNQKVTMVSLTPDVLDFNGYHAMVYRPLPGEEPVKREVCGDHHHPQLRPSAGAAGVQLHHSAFYPAGVGWRCRLYDRGADRGCLLERYQEREYG